jgi:lipopolysaccharide export system protein LptA
VKREILPVFFLILIAAGIAAENFTFQADKMSSVTAKGKERTVLTGNARIQSDSTLITADQIEMYGNDYRFALCSGSVTVVDDKNQIRLTSETLSYDRTDKISRVEGPSVMEDRKNKLVIKGSFLENNDTTEITVIQIGVRILKEDMACRSEFALYRRKDKTLELSGMPSVYWKGDEYKAAKITVNIDTDEIKLEGDVQGTIQKKEDSTKQGTDSSKTPADSSQPAPDAAKPPPPESPDNSGKAPN